jgi:RNA recognition motif-containing protein
MKRLFKDTEGLSTPVSIRINKRFAFVGLRDRRAAEDSVRILHGAHFMGDILRVELGKSVGKSHFSKRLNHALPFHRSLTHAPRSNFNNDIRSEVFFPKTVTFRDHSHARPRSVGDFGLESSRYPYGEPPNYPDTKFSPQSYRSYSGYPLVHCYQSVDRYRPTEKSQPLAMATQPQQDLYDQLRRQSLELCVSKPSHSQLMNEAEDVSRCSTREPYPSYYTSVPPAKFEDGRYGSRFPV